MSALAEWMRTVFGIVEEDDAELAIGRVRRTLARLATLGQSRPINSSTADRLLSLLGLVEWAPIGPRDTATPGGAELLRDPTVEAVVAVLAALVAEGPLVLVVDDAQWATGDLLGAVTQLANEVLGAVLFVTVGRSDLLTATWWDRMPDVEVLPVAPLDEAASERLLRAYLGGAELDVGTRDLLLDRAQGNPFFLAELLHLLVDRGLLRRDGGGWRLTGELPRDVLPAGVQAVLAARIDGLSPAARTLLRDASVLGNRFTADMLRSLEPLTDGGRRPGRAGARRAGRPRHRPVDVGGISEPPALRVHPRAGPRRRVRRHPEGRAGPPARDRRAMGGRRTALVGGGDRCAGRGPGRAGGRAGRRDGSADR